MTQATVSFVFLGNEFSNYAGPVPSLAVAQVVNDACMIVASTLTKYDCPDKWVVDTIMQRLQNGDAAEWAFITDAAAIANCTFYAYTSMGHCVHDLEQWQEQDRRGEKIRQLVWQSRNGQAELSVWYWDERGEYYWRYRDNVRAYMDFRVDDYEKLIQCVLMWAYCEALDRHEPVEMVL